MKARRSVTLMYTPRPELREKENGRGGVLKGARNYGTHGSNVI